jgi:hypothetical protein
MYTVRFNKEALHINICNLYPGLELTSPVYCSNSTCHISPSQQTCFGITSASFGVASNQMTVKGALLYKLRKKYTTKTDNLPNSNTTSVENTKTNTHLLAVWDIGDDGHKFYVCLIEFTNDFAWDEDKLWALLHQYDDQFYKNYNYITGRWLIHDNQGLKTRCNITYELDYKLNIVLYEGTGQYFIDKPVKINPKRSVLSLSMLILLMYAVRLNIRRLFKLNIHNQCLNVSLASPVYVTSNKLECHRPPDYKVYIGDTMKSGFIINKSGDASYGVLIYRLQRKQTYEYTKINKATSSVTQLLVVWRVSEFKELHADALLVEHNKRFDEGDLRKLYRKNFDRFRWFTYSATKTWLLDDNTALRTIFEIMNEGCLLSITISEVEKDDGTRTPVHIDPEK